MSIILVCEKYSNVKILKYLSCLMTEIVPQSVCLPGERCKSYGNALVKKKKSKIKVAMAGVAIHSQMMSVYEESLGMTPPFLKTWSEQEQIR